jgi:hypothetical protein
MPADSEKKKLKEYEEFKEIGALWMKRHSYSVFRSTFHLS